MIRIKKCDKFKDKKELKNFPQDFVYYPEDNRYLKNPIGICISKADIVTQNRRNKKEIYRESHKFKQDFTLSLVINEKYCKACIGIDFPCPKCNSELDIIEEESFFNLKCLKCGLNVNKTQYESLRKKYHRKLQKEEEIRNKTFMKENVSTIKL